MSDQTTKRQTKSRFTSTGTERLVTLAQGLLSGDTELGEVEKILDSVTQSLEELSDAEREQIEELTRLLRTDPDQKAAADKLARPGQFTVNTASDRMSMTLSIRPAMAGGEPVTVDQVNQWLAEHEITQGIDAGAIANAVEAAAGGARVEEVTIVRGTLPTEGEPERVVVFGRRDMEDELVEIDLEDPEAASANLCLEGDVILKKIPAQPGKPGFTAAGQPIPPPQPATVNVSAGPNVEMHGEQCLAKTGGLVIYENNRIEVRRMLVIDEDVTSRRDPIHFDGDIHVRASVRSGAQLSATGNITIDGSVEAAHVESTGGDVELRHGVTGGHEGTIKAAGSVSARFAENVTIRAGDDIIIDIGALHSRLIAYGAIRLVRGRGQMIGGSAMAGDLIELKQAGSSSGVRTELCVGLGRQAMQRLADLDTQVARLQLKQNEAVELAEKIRRTVGDPTQLQPDEIRTYTSLRQMQLVCTVKIRELRTRRDAILAEAAEETGGRIDVAVSLLPQVVVHIGDAEWIVDKPQHRCRVTYNPAKQDLSVNSLR